MWQRFTELARRAVFYAQEDAQKFGDGYVSTEHLLLGLLRLEHGAAIKVFGRLGVEPKDIREEIEKQIPRGKRPSQDLTLTPRAKRVIDLAYDEARSLDDQYIGTEHLLLGLVREGDGLAGRVLSKFGIELERCRKIVIEIQNEPEEDKAEVPPEKLGDQPGNKQPRSAGSSAHPSSHQENLFWEGRQPLSAPQLDSMHLLIRQGVAVPEFMLLASLGSDDGIAAQLISTFSSHHLIRSVTRDVLRSRSGEPSEVSMDHILAVASSVAKERGGPVTSGDLVLAVMQYVAVPELTERLEGTSVEELKERLKEIVS